MKVIEIVLIFHDVSWLWHNIIMSTYGKILQDFMKNHDMSWLPPGSAVDVIESELSLSLCLWVITLTAKPFDLFGMGIDLGIVGHGLRSKVKAIRSVGHLDVILCHSVTSWRHVMSQVDVIGSKRLWNVLTREVHEYCRVFICIIIFQRGATNTFQ